MGEKVNGKFCAIFCPKIVPTLVLKPKLALKIELSDKKELPEGIKLLAVCKPLSVFSTKDGGNTLLMGRASALLVRGKPGITTPVRLISSARKRESASLESRCILCPVGL
jgi:hypothetical protein